MNSKALLFGIVGFLMGGLVVSIAATLLDNDDSASGADMTTSQMMSELQDKSGDDFDATFIASMVEHHQGAIDMAELAESRAKHDEVKQLSQDIISAQEREMAQMRQWQQQWGYDDSMDGMDHSMP